MIAVDAHVLLPLLREDALTKIAQSVRAADREWVMPSLLKIEVVNALLNEVKAGYLTLEGAMQAVGTADELTAQAPVQNPAPREILATARQSGLTAYDATYVVLARSLGVHLITEDRQILRACPDVARSMRRFLGPPEGMATAEREERVVHKTRNKKVAKQP